jgi:hypothetical protein
MEYAKEQKTFWSTSNQESDMAVEKARGRIT